jgi:uncharacterized protein (UPF0332 family)
MSEAVDRQLAQARQALADATGAREADLSDAVVVNRLYYACFHAAQAVLYDRGVEPESHGGVVSLFGSEVVVAGDAPRDRGRFLNDLSTHRKRADYGTGPLDLDVDDLVADARTFVEEAEALVDG